MFNWLRQRMTPNLASSNDSSELTPPKDEGEQQPLDLYITGDPFSDIPDRLTTTLFTDEGGLPLKDASRAVVCSRRVVERVEEAYSRQKAKGE